MHEFSSAMRDCVAHQFDAILYLAQRFGQAFLMFDANFPAFLSIRVNIVAAAIVIRNKRYVRRLKERAMVSEAAIFTPVDF
jgi:hypothetical protein